MVISRLRRKHPGSSLASLIFYEFCRVFATALMSVLFGYRRRGGNNLPRDGAVLVVANHQSYLDPPMVGCAMPRRQFDFLARAGLFESKWLGPLITALHSVPVKEGGGDPASIKEILRRLEKGRVVLIFPEGTRSLNGDIGEFKRGVALILRKSVCPVLPVGISGAHHVWPRGGKPRVFHGKAVVQVGEPIPHDELMKDGPDAALARLRDEVSRLVDIADGLRMSRPIDALAEPVKRPS